MHGKDASVGEFDPVTGLTHITHQRGRLLFNMGASVKKRQRRDPPPAVAGKATPLTSTGTFTGLSLYPEEAHYLLQRGALTIYLMSSERKDAKELSVADFAAILLKDTRVSLACMQVYTFLKVQKLHPRRCLEPLKMSTEDGRSMPRHFMQGEHCDVAFDVWKTVTVEVEPTVDAGNTVQPTESMKTVVAKAKKQKKLVLVFRVIVCRYGDVAPSPRSLRHAIESSKARDLDDIQTPVKLAVVHHDQSVLLFEISAPV